MVLSRPDLVKLIDDKKLIFTPPVGAAQIEQVTIDLRLGHTFTRFQPPNGHMGAVRVTKELFTDKSYWHDEWVKDSYFLQPKAFVLAQTHEVVKIPNDHMALVEGKSSWARVGIGVHVTAPKIDPGFGPATITLEMYNYGEMTVELWPERHFMCQLIVLPISVPLNDAEAYGGKATDIFAKQTTPVPTK